MTRNTHCSNVVLITVDSLRADAIEPYADEHRMPAVGPEEAAAIERLRPLVRAHARSLEGAGAEDSTVEPDEAVEARLDALGYR